MVRVLGGSRLDATSMSYVVLDAIHTKGFDRTKDIHEFSITIDGYTTDAIAATNFCEAVKEALKELTKKTYEGRKGN